MLLRLRWYGHTETMDKEGMPPKNDCQNGRNMERRKTTGKMD
jgi:hypothetical protein